MFPAIVKDAILISTSPIYNRVTIHKAYYPVYICFYHFDGFDIPQPLHEGVDSSSAF